MIPPIEDCNFAAKPTGKGTFVGRVREFPDLRTRPYEKSIDALDDIISQTRDRLAAIASQRRGFGPEVPQGSR